MQLFQDFTHSGATFLKGIHFSFAQFFEIVLVFIVAKVILFFIARGLKRFSRVRKITEGEQVAVLQITRYVVWVIALTFVLQVVGINLTLLVASSAALLIGLGLGLQQVFSSVISGLTLLVEGSTRVEDVLQVDGEVVRVLRIGLRTSTLINRDDIVSLIPNSILVSNKITNWSHEKESTRFRMTISVAYHTDIDLALRLLEECAMESPVITSEAPPEGRLKDFGDSGILLELLFWSRENFRIERAMSDIRRSILKKFREHDIEIPFPQRVVHYAKEG